MTDFTAQHNLPEAPFSTNVFCEIGGVKHQITARGVSASDMTTNYFAAVDTLTTAYAARSATPPIDTARLFVILQCGMEKAAKAQDFDRARRLVKAAALVQAHAIEQTDEGYCVRSQGTPSVVYAITPQYACSCEDWQRHTQEAKWYCKHGLAVMMSEKLRA